MIGKVQCSMTDKELVKSWLFGLLAEVEVAKSVAGTRMETPSGKITLVLEIKKEDK
jgi:hypothetical protein